MEVARQLLWSVCDARRVVLRFGGSAGTSPEGFDVKRAEGYERARNLLGRPCDSSWSVEWSLELLRKCLEEQHGKGQRSRSRDH